MINSLTKKNDCNEYSDFSNFINLFGIQLCFDDVLLICLFLFLYTEKINDTYLLLSLILLFFN